MKRMTKMMQKNNLLPKKGSKTTAAPYGYKIEMTDIAATARALGLSERDIRAQQETLQ